MREAMALVLSGGGGDRLSVLTAERAVSAIPFGGKYRVIDFVLSNCCHSEIERIGVLTQHAPQSLHDHIGSGRFWDLDRRDARVLILQPYLTREHSLWYRGTADAVARNWDVVVESGVSRVLVLPGDHVYKMDYRPLFESHARHGAAVTLAVAPVPSGETRRFGMVTLQGDRVVALDEKPSASESRIASMGILLFDTPALEAALARPVVDLAADVLSPLLEAGIPVHAHHFDGYWEDVGTLHSYYRANMDLLRPEPSLQLDDPAWPILSRDEERPPVRILPGARLEESLVANGCRVAGHIRRSILFPGVIVEEGAEVVDSVLMQDVHVEAGARIERAIVDKLARVGRGALVGGGGGEAVEPTLVGKYAVTPPGARVGAGAVLGIGAGADDFKGAEVPAGERVRDRLEKATP